VAAAAGARTVPICDDGRMARDLRHVRYFVAAAGELNFTRAAERLQVTQQSLSLAVRQFEQELGVRLFDRTTRKVELTPAGVRLLPRARTLLALADEVFAGGPGDEARLLTVDISSSGLETGAAVLRHLRETDPDLAVRQVEIGVPAGVAALREGTLDVLFGNAVHVPDDIAVELVRLEPVQVLLPAGHRLAGAGGVPVATLAEECWLLPSDELAPEWTEQVVNACQQAGFRPRRYPGLTHGSAAAAELVLEGRCVVPTTGWTALPAGVVARQLVEPAALFPWSMMWVEAARREAVTRLLAAARTTSATNGWLKDAG
jgi:DNA-binding transcriptional LysR family regulator